MTAEWDSVWQKWLSAFVGSSAITSPKMTWFVVVVMVFFGGVFFGGAFCVGFFFFGRFLLILVYFVWLFGEVGLQDTQVFRDLTSCM